MEASKANPANTGKRLEVGYKKIITSPSYSNLLNRKRKNKSRRGDLRKNEQYDRIEQNQGIMARSNL